MSEQLKQCLVCNSQDVEICSIDDEGIYYEWCCNNCDTSIRGDNPGFLYIGHVTEAKKLLDKSRNELAALTAERDKLKAENEELKSYQRDLCTDIDRLQRNETGMIKEIAERIIKQRQTEAELTAAVDMLMKESIIYNNIVRQHGVASDGQKVEIKKGIKAALKTVVEKGDEDVKENSNE